MIRAGRAASDAPSLRTGKGTERSIGSPASFHSALLCNLGVIFNEIVWLKDLAESCASDSQYTFLFAGAPLKLVYGCGSAVNPMAIK